MMIPLCARFREVSPGHGILHCTPAERQKLLVVKVPCLPCAHPHLHHGLLPVLELFLRCLVHQSPCQALAGSHACSSCPKVIFSLQCSCFLGSQALLMDSWCDTLQSQPNLAAQLLHHPTDLPAPAGRHGPPDALKPGTGSLGVSAPVLEAISCKRKQLAPFYICQQGLSLLPGSHPGR